MPGWDDINSAYAESIKNTLPLYRVLIALTALICLIGTTHQTHLSIAETIASIKISWLFEEKSSPFLDVRIRDILFSALIPATALISSRTSTKLIFSLICRSEAFKLKLNAASKNKIDTKSMSLSDRKKLIDFFDNQLKNHRNSLKTRNSISEILFGIAIIFFVMYYWGNALDIIVAIVATILAIISCASALIFFFTNYYGLALHISQLEGSGDVTPNV